jgi:predicted flap endonuclease-1-like 5' DNA nuclease
MIAQIYLFAGPSNCALELLLGLAMSLIPALLALLAARSFFKVDDLRENNARLTSDNGALNIKVNGLNTDNTELRVRLTQLEADLEAKDAQVGKYRNNLMLIESERNALREQLAECQSAAALGAVAGAAPVDPAFIMYNGSKYHTDDLKIVEGIGPKIEELLHADGIRTWLALGEAHIERLQKILDAAGTHFAMHNPATWPRQSMMAHQGDWEGLKKLQDELTAGRE